MTADPNHTANQYNVARRLVAILSGPFGGEDAVMEMDDDGWRAAVKLARIIDPTWKPSRHYPPSESTRRLVAEMIKAETAPAPTTDPFAGLPGVDD